MQQDAASKVVNVLPLMLSLEPPALFGVPTGTCSPTNGHARQEQVEQGTSPTDSGEAF